MQILVKFTHFVSFGRWQEATDVMDGRLLARRHGATWG